MQLLQLKIKDNVDLAGPFPQLDLYKELIISLKNLLPHFLNNNLLIAPIVMETMDAEED